MTLQYDVLEELQLKKEQKSLQVWELYWATVLQYILIHKPGGFMPILKLYLYLYLILHYQLNNKIMQHLK